MTVRVVFDAYQSRDVMCLPARILLAHLLFSCGEVPKAEGREPYSRMENVEELSALKPQPFADAVSTPEALISH